ncbi:MAG: hypothetical protein R3E48_04840 [Burkholderiaceae bacterium]
MRTFHQMLAAIVLIAIASVAGAQGTGGPKPKGSCRVSAPIDQPAGVPQKICGSVVNTCDSYMSARVAVVTLTSDGPAAGGTHSLAIANGSNIQPGGAGSGCLTFAGPAVTAHNVTRLVGILTQCASGPQRAPLVTLSVREELGDPTVFAAYAAPTRPITVEDTTYGLVSRICATAAAQ